jgi:hypothetical protein
MGERDSAFIIEISIIGRTAKVSAVDPVTGIEASIVGPADAGRETLSRNAVAKLKYVLAKREG